MTFKYSTGEVILTDGGKELWRYSIQDSVGRQAANQPNTLNIPGVWWGDVRVSMGVYRVTNMALGLSDDNFRRRFAIGSPNMTDYATYIEEFKPQIYLEAQQWIYGPIE